MDDIYRSQAQQEALLAIQLKQAISRPWLPWVGCCYNCETTTPEGVNFCDGDCRDDYEARCRLSGGQGDESC